MVDAPASVNHPLLKAGALEDRLYQSRIAQTALDHNTLAVLPTGLGKTAIALRVMAEYLLRDPKRSVLFLAPTRPLVVQHARSVESTIVAPPPLVLTGTVSPERRSKREAGTAVIVATPQVVGNDLARGTLDLGEFSLIVFDEAHRAVGDYPYVTIGRANRDGPRCRVLAMTASPGSRIERIREVWANLGIERFEYRTADDPDVRPYVFGIGVETVEVPLPPEVRALAVELRAALQSQTQKLHKAGYVASPTASRRDLLDLRARVQREAAVYRARREPIPPSTWGVITGVAIAMKILHALDLIETQGVDALREFLRKQESATRSRPSPAGRAFLTDPFIVRASSALATVETEHPKLEKTVRVVRDQFGSRPDSRVIVFAQYRQTAERLTEMLTSLHDPTIRAARFVGQASHAGDVGLSQREQVSLLDRFRSGEVNCLVATSVAEEGLDVPSTDLVIFYEPVPDVVRTIQRRGRTGRLRTGRAVVLVTEGTRDVAVHRGSRSRERRMHEMLETIQSEAAGGSVRAPRPEKTQRFLEEFGPV